MSLKTLPDTLERARLELALQVALGVSFTVPKGFGDPEVEHAYVRARFLCLQLGTPPALVPVLYGFWNFCLVRCDLQAAHEWADQILPIAEQGEDATFLLAAHNAQTQSSFEQGNLRGRSPAYRPGSCSVRSTQTSRFGW